jgi:hypothetical protein
MLSLRKGLLTRKRSSASSILTADGQNEENSEAARSAMETIRAGLQESAKGLSSDKILKHSDTTVSVKSVSDADSVRSETTVSIADDARSIVTMAESTTKTFTSTSTSTIHISRVIETSRTIRGHVCQLGDYDDAFFKGLDIDSYLEYISEERLIHMPRRGSDWDRVLRAAQCFGFQLWRFGSEIAKFCPGTDTAAVTALGSTKILLEVSLPCCLAHLDSRV